MIVAGDCLQVLSAMPSESVHCCITSPPYWGLRSYQGDPGMIGLEPTLEEHIERLVAVFHEVRRVLRSDGTLWLNYGDAYSAGDLRPSPSSFQERNRGSTDIGRRRHPGLKPKNLMMMPARVALALQSDGADTKESQAISKVISRIQDAYDHDEPPPDKVMAVLELLETEYIEARGDSWYLRSEIIWHKPNPMPESVTSRPTSAHEKLFLFAKSGNPTHWLHEDGRGSRTKPEPDYKWLDAAGLRHSEFDGEENEDCLPVGTEWTRRNQWRGRDYFYDAEAVRVPNSEGSANRMKYRKEGLPRRDESASDSGIQEYAEKVYGSGVMHGANLRNVWRIPVHAYKGAHFATFSPALVEPCIKAGTSAKGVCGACGAPWVRQVEVVQEHISDQNVNRDPSSTYPADMPKTRKHTTTLGWHPSCSCEADIKPAIVCLDPFRRRRHRSPGSPTSWPQGPVHRDKPRVRPHGPAAGRARPARHAAAQPREAGRLPTGVYGLNPIL